MNNTINTQFVTKEQGFSLYKEIVILFALEDTFEVSNWTTFKRVATSVVQILQGVQKREDYCEDLVVIEIAYWLDQAAKDPNISKYYGSHKGVSAWFLDIIDFARKVHQNHSNLFE